jgi:hypothetical protein
MGFPDINIVGANIVYLGMTETDTLIIGVNGLTITWTSTFVKFQV